MDMADDTPASVEELLARYPRPWVVEMSDPYVSVRCVATGETVCALRGVNEHTAAQLLVELANAGLTVGVRRG